MSLFSRLIKNHQPRPLAADSGGTVPATGRVPDGLVSLTKKAAVSLTKHGLTGQRAAVQLVLDHSGSMTGFYHDGSVQRLAEQALALSVNLDDDGSVPLTYFGSRATPAAPVSLTDYKGIIHRTHTKVAWGSTNYVAALNTAVEQHVATGTTLPGLVIFQTDGAPDDRAAAAEALREASTLPIFWAFIGFGHNIHFLERLDDLSGRAVDNASFFHAADPQRVSDEELLDGITSQYRDWLTAATAAGILQ